MQPNQAMGNAQPISSRMTSKQTMQLVLKGIQAACFTLGPTITAFNVFSFKVARGGGAYYLDSNQYWIAFGVLLISAGLVIRHWKKL